MAGDNSAAGTNAFITNTACGGFAGLGGQMDVFARFIAPSTGVYRFSTYGSVADTAVSVHTGCPVTDENLVGCNDDACDSQS